MKVQCLITSKLVEGRAMSKEGFWLKRVAVPAGTTMRWSWFFCAYTAHVRTGEGYHHDLVVARPPDDAIEKRFEEEELEFFDISFVDVPADPLCRIVR